MTASGPIPPPPGWYPDPAGERAWRWWDGGRWTGYASDPTAPGGGNDVAAASTTPPWAYGPGPVTGPPVPSARHALAAAEAMAPWAERAFIWYPLVIVVGLLSAWAESSSFRQIFHALRIQASTGVAQPQVTDGVRTTNLGSLVTLVVAAPFYVLVLTWQYRAARTARLLHLPAAHSAGLGVGSWFIPVVNFWFPYQAFRDCLPAGHPDRRLVNRMWACFISVLVANLVAQVLAWVGTPVGFLFAAGALALGVGFAGYGVRAVRSITTTHRRLLGLE